MTATEGIAEQYAEKYPFAAEKLVPILNGFDCDDLPRRVEPFPKFTIAYTGFFYGAQSPETFARALGRIVREGLIPVDEFEFLWAGRDAPWVREMLRREGAGPVVRYVGLVPKAEADALLSRSHLLFFLLGENEHVSQTRILTGKIFPYLASGRPILAVVPRGEARDLIEAYAGEAAVVENGDVDGVVHAILDAFARWKAGALPSGTGPRTQEFRRRYNYRVRTGELAAVFDEVPVEQPGVDLEEPRADRLPRELPAVLPDPVDVPLPGRARRESRPRARPDRPGRRAGRSRRSR